MSHRPAHPSNYSRPLRDLEHADKLVDKIITALPLIWPRIADGVAGQPSAQNYDGDTGDAGSVLDDQGVPMPALSDPTGEACTRRDPCRADLDRLRHLARQLRHHADEATRILARHQPRPADGYQRHHTADGDPGCRSCARLEVGGAPRWEPVYKRRTVGDEAVELCRWCYDWHRHTGTLPARRLLCDHHDGKRVRLPVDGAA